MDEKGKFMEKTRELMKKVTIAVTIILGLVIIFHLVRLVSVSNHAVYISTQNLYYSGVNGFCEIRVIHQKTRQPLEANLKIRLLDAREKPLADLYSGKTEPSGRSVVNFEIPKLADGEYFLEINARSKYGRDVIKKNVPIYSEQSSGNVTITLNKALYKPGDTIQYRVLVTDRISDKPVGNEIEVVILDGRENQVYKKNLQTSAFGIASGSFTLADRVNSGMYTMKVRSGIQTYLYEFEVKPYKLPKFEVTVTTRKEEYMVGEELNGTIKAQYFFGQPVKNAEVEIQCGQTQTIRQTLNEQGECSFSFKISTEGQYGITASVTDSSNNRETGSKSVFYSDKNVKISLRAENNTIIPGIPNEIFIFVSKPDGSPLKTYLKILGDANLELATDESGMASFFLQSVMSDRVMLEVHAIEYDESSTFELSVSENWSDVVIRPDKPVYRENETVNLSINRQRDGAVWIYAVKNGQIISSVKTESDRADLLLPAGTYGMIDLLYGLENPNQNSIYRSLTSSRSVFVRPEKSLNLNISKQDKIYRPGEDIALNFEATDEKGGTIDSAILLTIADEALLSLADNDITLDNIKLALNQIEEERGVDAGELYDAILNNSSDAVLTSLMLNDNVNKPQIIEHNYNNYQKRHSIIRSLFTWSVCGILLIIILLCIIFEKFRAVVLYFLGYLPVFLLSVYIAEKISWRYGYRWEIIIAVTILFLFLAAYIALAVAFHKAVKADKQLRYIFIPVYIFLVIIGIALIISGYPPVHYKTSDIQSASGGASSRDGGIFDSFKFDTAASGSTTAPSSTPSIGSKDEQQEVEQPGKDFAAVEKIRRRFMEVMFFHPQLEAKNGMASITVPLADNITDWKIQAVANSMEGHIGSGTASIRVFQEFFVDFDTPWNLAVGDEAGIPVTVSNYLEQPQKVKLQVHKADWFELTDGNYTLEMELNAQERKLVYIPVKVKAAGNHKLRVDAAGQVIADAVEKEIRVYPAGLLRQEIAAAGRFEKESINQVFFVTPDIEDARNIRIKLFPSSMGQVAEGLEAMLRFPDGCFEQISSSLYPNILILKYLRDNNLSSPEIEKKAYEYIERGFQKILTYEVKATSGAFSLYGQEPPENVLTAYGLMEFTDLSKVYNVDQGLLDRMKEYLFTQQNSDGSFKFQEHYYGGPNTSDSLALNAYIGWALSEACPDDLRLQKTVTYLKAKTSGIEDGYTLALIANILVNTKDKGAKELLDRLASLVDLDNRGYVKSTTRDYYGACGGIQDLQATALTSVALSRAKLHQQLNNRLINYILSQRDSYGTFGNTQSTILSLKALVAATEAATMKEGTITLNVNDREEKVEIGPDSLSYYLYDFKGAGKENTVRIQAEGCFNYEIIKEYYVPYDSVKSGDSFEISRIMGNSFYVNDEVTEEIRIVNRHDATVENMMVLVQIPQGFTVNDTFLESLKAEGIISEYSIGYDQIEVYIRKVQPQEVKTLKLGYWAGYPIKAVTGAITVYDYYNPNVEAILPPIEITVKGQGNKFP